MRVLVTGGAGFIGGRVVQALLGRGHEVHVLDNLSTGHAGNVARGASFDEIDVRDRSRVHALVARIRPDVVCHQAAQTSIDVSTRDPVGDAQTNIVGSLHLLDACVRYDVSRVVFASTGGAIYGEVPEGQRADASWAPKPASPYACAKLAVEQYLQSGRRDLRQASASGPEHPHSRDARARAPATQYGDGPAVPPARAVGPIASYPETCLQMQKGGETTQR